MLKGVDVAGKWNVNTPLAIHNQIDRFSLAIDVIDRVPTLEVAGAHAKEINKSIREHQKCSRTSRRDTANEHFDVPSQGGKCPAKQHKLKCRRTCDESEEDLQAHLRSKRPGTLCPCGLFRTKE